jgi:hypothetical protein
MDYADDPLECDASEINCPACLLQVKSSLQYVFGGSNLFGLALSAVFRAHSLKLIMSRWNHPFRSLLVQGLGNLSFGSDTFISFCCQLRLFVCLCRFLKWIVRFFILSKKDAHVEQCDQKCFGKETKMFQKSPTLRENVLTRKNYS